MRMWLNGLGFRLQIGIISVQFRACALYEIEIDFVAEYTSMKTCSVCSNEVAELATRSSKCKPCHNAYTRQHYADNKQYYIDKAKRNNKVYLDQARVWVGEYLVSHPCVDCGNTDHRVLEFDHRDPTTKVADVSDMMRNRSLAVVQSEVAKCDVRCANCHRIRTAEQFGWFVYLPV